MHTDDNIKKVLVAGGTGLVGKRLCEKLRERGFSVVLLSRKKHAASDVFHWNVEEGEMDGKALENVCHIINLSGENVGKGRWTKKRKQQIIDSRVKSTTLLLKKVKEQKANVKSYISASAVGYYGSITSEKIFSEADAPSNDFMGITCQKWELAADKFKPLGIRTVKLRTGIALAKKGGALSKMVAPVNMGIASAIGSGRQYVPWIHIDDLCDIYIKAIEDNQMDGVYNVVAPQHATNEELMKALAFVLQKPFWFPNIPARIMQWIFGEMSTILLNGSRVSADKLLDAGYAFQFPELEGALRKLLE